MCEQQIKPLNVCVCLSVKVQRRNVCMCACIFSFYCACVVHYRASVFVCLPCVKQEDVFSHNEVLCVPYSKSFER